MGSARNLLTLLSLAGLVVIASYILQSLSTAFWMIQRHGQYFHLEFAPHRALGTKEPKRLRTLLVWRRLAAAALVIEIGVLAGRVLLM